MRTAIIVALFIAIVSPAFTQQERPDPFERFFTLPGIEFSKDQQAKANEIRKDFEAKLVENQKKWNSVITEEQVQAPREAFQRARKEGKQGRELRDTVSVAVKLTDEQRKQQAAIQQERNELFGQIRTKLIGLLTDEQQRSIRTSTVPWRSCIVYAGGQVLGGGERISPVEFIKQEFGMTE